MIPTLEILLPTYKRPCRAKEAMESVLSCNDDRLTIRCNSNGYEPDLEKYRNINKRLNYDCFQTNQGPQANVLKLFSNTNAKFCMILSDEDRVNSKHCNDMLDFLENLDIDNDGKSTSNEEFSSQAWVAQLGIDLTDAINFAFQTIPGRDDLPPTGIFTFQATPNLELLGSYDANGDWKSQVQIFRRFNFLGDLF